MTMDFVKADSRNLPIVHDIMILEFLTSNDCHYIAEIRGAKILMSSRISYLETAVGYVKVCRTPQQCTVQAEVVPEHKVRTKNYTVKAVINEQREVIVSSQCDGCPAAADTEELYTIGFQNIASRYGKNFTFDLKCQIMGQQSREFAASIIKGVDIPMTVDEFLDETRLLFEKMFPDCQVMPGVKRLIHHLHDNNIPIGLATSSSIESYEMKTQKHKDLFSLLPCKTWGSSDPAVKRGKPYPDIFLVAADKFPDKPAPEKCLVFEDSLNGVRAARAAGMQVVMVPDPQLDKSLATEATLVIDSMEQFQPELFGLPAFKV